MLLDKNDPIPNKYQVNGHNDKKPQDLADFEFQGDEHLSNAIATPIRSDAFAIDDDKKIELIAQHFKEIMHILGLDLSDNSLKGTPHRVAKMYVKEIFSGLNPKNLPTIRLFENQYQYQDMLLEKDITFYSTCEHHFIPIYGKAHVAYIPSEKVVGLSKINRLVQHFAKRPQVQERMTIQIAEALKKHLNTQDIAVVIEADHMCVAARGVKDVNSSTVTTQYHGKFEDASLRAEFLKHVYNR